MFFRFFYFTVYLLTFLSMGMWGCCCPIDGMILVPSHTCHANLSIRHFIFGVDNEGLANESGIIHDIYIYMYIYMYIYICIYIYIHMYMYIWVNYNDLTATSLEFMVSKGNHPQMA